jgi:effector-binding domain-containing protein
VRRESAYTSSDGIFALVKLDAKVVQLQPRLVAAVRRTAAPREIAAVCQPALHLVWAFLRAHPGLRTDGHNVFLYQHVENPEDGMPIDFGIEVSRRFEAEGEVRCVETPAGKAASTVHVGPYTALPLAHAALHVWCRKNGHQIGTRSLEVFGPWSYDSSNLVTTIQYVLR